MENQIPLKRTQAERTKQSKARIVQEANRLFGKNGYYGTRMADIAEAAGLTGPGLLHHFASKEELLVAVLENRDRVDLQRYETLFKNSAGMNAMDALHALVEYNQTIPEVVRMFTVLSAESTTPDHPGHEFFVQRYRFFRQQYLDLLKVAQGQGKIRADIDVEQLGMLVMAVMDGLQLQWLLDPEQVDMAATFGMFAQILNQGLHAT